MALLEYDIHHAIITWGFIFTYSFHGPYDLFRGDYIWASYNRFLSGLIRSKLFPDPDSIHHINFIRVSDLSDILPFPVPILRFLSFMNLSNRTIMEIKHPLVRLIVAESLDTLMPASRIQCYLRIFNILREVLVC